MNQNTYLRAAHRLSRWLVERSLLPAPTQSQVKILLALMLAHPDTHLRLQRTTLVWGGSYPSRRSLMIQWCFALDLDLRAGHAA
jgi:hypothetical protein